MQYCAEPQRRINEADALRPSAQKRGYTYRWSLISKRFLRAHPVCGERHDGTKDAIHSRCVQKGIDRAAECVDHTIPKHKGGTDDEENLMSSCFRCNNWKGKTLDRQP